jgi:hypothetical protein
LWVLFIYCIYDFLTNLGLLYLSHKPAKVFLYSSFTFIEYILFVWILFLSIKNQRFRKIIQIASSFFLIFLIAYNLSINVKGIDSVPIGIEAILILIFSFYYFYEQMNGTQNLFIYNKSSFWTILGMMLYLAGSFFIYIYASQLASKEVAKYWIFTNIFSIIKNLFFTVAILVNSRQKKGSASDRVSYNLHPLNQL